jgi:hypothetical protein
MKKSWNTTSEWCDALLKHKSNMLHVFLKHLVSDKHVVFQTARGIKRLNCKSLVLSRGYVVFNLCCISFQLCTGTPSWWNHNLYLILRGASSSSLSNIDVRSLRNLWTLNFSGSRKRSTKRSRRYQPKISSWSGLDICERVKGIFGGRRTQYVNRLLCESSSERC